MEWQFPWPYRNNNPIAQMLEMVHYILRLIITMKHVIYRTILNAAGGSGVALYKLHQRGLGRSPSGNPNLMHFNLKIWHLVAPIFHFPCLFHDFSKKYFPLSLTFPWPIKFPDFFQFSLTCRSPVNRSTLLYFAANAYSRQDNQSRAVLVGCVA